jgi:hypothetical protein
MARRLKIGFAKIGFAKIGFAKIGFARWHKAKSGRGLSQNLTLIILGQIPGLSADWLLRGRPEGLSYEMARVLGVPDQTD